VVSTRRGTDEEKKVGDTIWNEVYGAIDFSGIPYELFNKGRYVDVQVVEKVMSFKLSVFRPYMKHRNSCIKVYPFKPKFINDYENMCQEYEKYCQCRINFGNKIYQFLHSVTTTKKLIEIWPEVINFIPIDIVNSSIEVTLPILNTDEVNSALGIQK